MPGKVLLVLYKGGISAEEQPKMIGCAERELGLRPFIEKHGYTLVTTTDKDGEHSEFEKEIVDAEIVITCPFYPAYVNRERIEKAKKLKICITAGVGSDHVDLTAANERKIAVIECTGSNVQSVAEHAMMTILNLTRNFVDAHTVALEGTWDIARACKNEFDLEDKVVGTVGAGRIGYKILERLVAFNPKKLYYYDYQPLPQKAVDDLNTVSKIFNNTENIVEKVESLEEMVSKCDIVTINAPLHKGTLGLFNKELISKMKDGAILVNTARGAICNAQDVADAVNSGKLLGYGGDVWYPQPPPKDHPWITMRPAGNDMTPHISGTSIDAQQRYSKMTQNILGEYFSGKQDYRPQDIIVINGDYYTKSYGQHK